MTSIINSLTIQRDREIMVKLIPGVLGMKVATVNSFNRRQLNPTPMRTPRPRHPRKALSRKLPKEGRLVDELRDILYAEKQLIKALPQMAEAARFDQLRELFEQHLIETENQIERINECFSLLGETARAKSCKGSMMRLVEEGQEVMG